MHKFLFFLKVHMKIDGITLYPTTFTKFLGIYIDQHLNWQAHINQLTIKLSRIIGMLTKIRYFVSMETRLITYFSISSSHLTYGCQIWPQNNNIHL